MNNTNTAATSGLTEPAARSLIAECLADAKRDPALLSPRAIAALVAHAGGSEARLREAVAASLAMAQTQGFTRPSPRLIAKAIAEGAPARRPSPVRPEWLTLSRACLYAATALLAVSLAALVIRAVPSPPPPPAQARQAPSAPPAHPTAIAVARPAPPPASLSPLAQQHAAIPPPPPRPQPAAQPAPEPALPAAPPTTVLLAYPAHDPAAAARLPQLLLALQQAGAAEIRTRATHAQPPPRAIAFFYTDDRKQAEAVATTLSAAGWPHLAAPALQPLLVLPPAHAPARNPGTIDVQLP